DAASAVMEMTLQGATLRFNYATHIALAGADMGALLESGDEERALENWAAHAVKAGDTLRLSGIKGAGLRGYLAVSGGFDTPEYLGSRATFTLGNFGGHGGRALRAGDVLKLNAPQPLPSLAALAEPPQYAHAWQIAVHYGPHGAPDFFTDEDIDMFFGTDWEVHFNSSRTGVRLNGPKPRWARTDGGEAGLHPSNIHDNAYAIGSIDFTGDMPVILGPDGPSLGGFVCPAVIVSADLWKMGQLKPGDKVRFIRVTPEQAVVMRDVLESSFDVTRNVKSLIAPVQTEEGDRSPAIAGEGAYSDGTRVLFRRAGDDYLLAEFGDMVLDITLRFKVHALMQAIERAALPGVIDLTPGIRSLQIHFDHRKLSSAKLIDLIDGLLRNAPSIDAIVVPSRIVHLPLAWNDSQTQLAIQKYETTVRPGAPWCPSNIEFIRRINGLAGQRDVYDVVFGASYMVLGLGDVYLGAPVATPVDPRHRLVTTKYNPARTWTPENAVGIGGAYMCVYGMEGPGGYQFVGRTVQMWNRYRQTGSFRDGHPWLLRLFDQIRFYEVSEEQLLRHRQDFPLGRFEVRIEETTFSLADYNQFLQREQQSIAAFKEVQQASFHAERERWIANGQADFVSEEAGGNDSDGAELAEGSEYLTAEVPGSVWQILAEPGQELKRGDVIAIFESMKMEISLKARSAGVVSDWLVAKGTPVNAGQRIAVFKPHQ
ncbi:MAG TPA: carboxyltransferase domain-containing protein, partial [Duganella sp.]|nr:carboxyltransferase domain-containing protein [Duganella sp.]